MFGSDTPSTGLGSYGDARRAHFGGDCCAYVHGRLLGIAATVISSHSASSRSSQASHVPHLHHFYALQDNFPFHLVAISPPFCLDRAGGMTLRWNAGGESANSSTTAGARTATVCEMRQSVRGLMLAPALRNHKAGGPGHLLLSVGVNGCEASIVRLNLSVVLALLAPVALPRGSRMPRIIHQVWISREHAGPPATMSRWITSWQRVHPTWTVHFWTAGAIRALISSHYPWLLQTYDRFDVVVKRADLARYLLLHRFGGVAVDIDLEALRPICGLLRPPSGQAGAGAGRALQIAEHDVQRGLLSIGFMAASAPQHPLWWHLLHEARRLAHTEPGLYVVQATGNSLLTRAAQHPSFRGEVRRIPRSSIFPLPYTHKKTRAAHACRASVQWCMRQFPLAYTVHHAAHSWAAEDAYREPDELYERVASSVDGKWSL